MVPKSISLLMTFATILGYHGSLQETRQGFPLHREKRDMTLVTCLDKYEAIPGHTMCLANVTQHPVNKKDQTVIVDKHNQARRNMSPAAADMLQMYYDTTLETEAQLWAEHCKLTHERSYKRFLPGRFPVGQNIVTSKSAMKWDAVIDLWNSESSKFTFGGPGNRLKDVGHYTQLMWASTSLVGCGMAKCGDTFFYVCNYGPSGNINTVDHPYTNGSPCDSCSGTCKQKLCDCKGKVCANGGSLDPSNCKCSCNKLKLYNNNLCELECKEDGDNSLCGVHPYDKASCTSNTYASVNCPWLCDICPYAGKNYKEDSVPLPTRSSSTTALTSWLSVVLLTLSITWLCTSV